MEELKNYKDTMEDDWLDFKNEIEEGNIELLEGIDLSQAELLFKYFYIMRRSGFDAAREFVIPYHSSDSEDTTYLAPPHCLLTNQCNIFCPHYNCYCECNIEKLKLWNNKEKYFRPIIPTDW